MQRCAITFIAFAFICGCGQKQDPPAGGQMQPSILVVVQQPGSNPPNDNANPKVDPLPSGLTPQERYDQSIAQAFRLLAEKNEEQALAAFQQAQAAQDTEFVRGEIDRLNARATRAAAIEHTIQDVKAVLASGRAVEAGKLATDALDQFGDTDAASDLSQLKRQADALIAVQQEGKASKQKFINEAEAARQAKNYRAALLAFDQAVAIGADVADYRDYYDKLRERLTQYDQQRTRATELRRDAAKLEEAVAALEEARKNWDTPQIAQELEETKLALQNRRDRVAVADFEVVGDVGIPLAGRALADDLLPHFKSRFDLVERGQIAAIVQELKLEANDVQFNEQNRSEIGRLAKARFLVVGSVSRLYGLTVNARLVDVQTGLVVQTAKIVAADPRELSAKLKTLAAILMMSDEEKIANERELAKAATIAPPTNIAIPPPPVVPALDVAVEPIVAFTPRPPEFGPIVIEDFRIPPPLPQPSVVVFADNAPWRGRAVFLALELGDNLFRRGLYREAHRHFEFALSLTPGNADIRLRVDRCRPFLPPPPVIVIVPRPRLAVLPFAEIGRPGFVPLGTGAWVADAIAPYFGSMYDVVDRGEVFWWMGRLGFTLRDVLIDPSARLCLARAMGVRFFLTGNLRETASFNATTYLIDAEFNAQIGSGMVHVHNPFELKLRLGELARLTQLPPAQQAVFVEQTVVVEKQIQAAELHIGKGKFQLAIGIYREVLVTRPDSVQARFALAEAERRQRMFEMEEARRLAFERDQAIRRAEQERQRSLAAEAERQRIEAERFAAARAEADRRMFAQQQQQAQVQLVFQARNAAKNLNFNIAINLFESAHSMNRSPEVANELALLRVQSAEANNRRIAQEQAAREAALNQQRQRDIEVARLKVEAEQHRRAQEEAARRQAEAAPANAAYQRLLDQADQAKAKGQFDVAVSALQTARQLKPSAEIDRLVTAALIDQARADAAKNGEAEKKKLEAQLAQEQERRRQAEIAAAENKAKYETAINLARAAMKQRKFAEAKQQFQLAAQTVRTDEAINGQRQAEDEIAKAQAAANAARLAQEAQQKKDAQVATLIADSRKAATAKQFDQAMQLLNNAATLNPMSVEVQSEIIKVRQAREDFLAANRKPKDNPDPQAAARMKAVAVAQALDRARSAIKTGKFDDAATAITDAGKIDPSSADIGKVQQELSAARNAMASTQKMAALQKMFDASIADARSAIAMKKFDDADKALTQAKQLIPTDPAIARLQQEITDARKTTAANLDAAMKQAQFERAVNAGKVALNNKKYADAVQQFSDALKIKPDRMVDQLLTQARSGMANEELQAKRLKDYNDAMKAAQILLAAGKYDDALKSANAALQAVANDPAAAQLVKRIEKAKTDAATAQAEMDRQKNYSAAMKNGQVFMQQKQYAQAVASFTEALRLAPNDSAATKALADARDALNPPKKDTPKVDPPKKDTQKTDPPKKDAPKADPQQQLNAILKAAATFEGQSKYAEALGQYQEALKMVPNHAELKKKIDFCKEMADSIRDLKAGRFAEATIGFDLALKLYPNDANAKHYLQMAKEKKKQ